MDIISILGQLREERDALDVAIASLECLEHQQHPGPELLNLKREWITMREGQLTGTLASKERDQSGLVRTHEEHPVVVHNADAEPVKPTGATKEVSAECRILGEKDNRRKLNAKRLNGDLVLIGCERSSHGPKTLKPAGFNFQSENLGVLALKDAMRGASIQFRQEIDRLAPMASVIGTLMPSVASVYLCVLSNSSETGILTSPE